MGAVGLSAEPQPVVFRRPGLLTMTNSSRNRTMRSINCLAVLAGLITLGSCKSLNVDDLNYPSVDQLGPGASVAAIRTAVQGLVSVPRSGIIGAGSASATASALAGYGRETVTLNTTGTGDITTYVSIDLDAWYDPWLSTYKTMAQANVILK